MSIALEQRIWWRKIAPFHVQLELEKSHCVTSISGETRVQGRAIRVFRTDGLVAAGDRIAFRIYVCEPGDEPIGPACIYFDEFMRATHMEVYLDGTPPECELAAYEFSVIDAPSDQPNLTIEELENLNVRYKETPPDTARMPGVRRSWQFWKP